MSTFNLPPPGLSVYPNPSQDFLKLDFASLREGSLLIYNSSGQFMKKVDFDTQGLEKGQAQLSIRGLDPGTYFIKINTAEGLNTLEFVKY